MISVVIPNYNGVALLKKNLSKVFNAIKRVKHEVIVVDDASTDESVKFLAAQKVKLLRNSENSGFASTVNKGVEAAKGDIVVLLNTDGFPQRDFLKYVLPHFRDPQVFAVACLEKSIENGRTVLRGRGIGKWDKGLLVHSKGRIDKTNTLWANGGSSAFRRSLWNKLGGLDEIYNPFYWEDIDLSYRALKSGYRIVFEPRSIFFHYHQKGTIRTNYSAFQIKTISVRNQFIFAWKNGTDILLELNQILFLPYHIFKAVKNKNWAFLIGFFDAFRMLPEIIKLSLRDRGQFIKSDREVIKKFRK